MREGKQRTGKPEANHKWVTQKTAWADVTP